MGQRERVRQAIEAPVSEADKLLEELESADTETRLSILISGWGRGLAAGLEELALAVDDLHQQPRAAPIPTPTTPTPSRASRPSPTEDRSAQSDLGDASEEQLADEARRSRDATAEMRKETEEARRELEP
jgi:hypothetical protein